MSISNTKKKAAVSMEVVDSGKYKAQVYKKDKETGELVLQRESGWSDNIITDLALDAMASGTGLTSSGSIQVGTGTTPETGADTSLENGGPFENSATFSLSTSYPSVPYYTARTFVYTFSEGAATGTWTEVGKWSGNSTSGTFTSRSLFKDEFGDPTSITVLADEILRITYEARRYPPDTDFTDTVDGYNITVRAADVDNTNAWAPLAGIPVSQTRVYAGPIGPINGTPTGSTYISSTTNRQAYVPGSFESLIDYTWDTSNANDTLESVLTNTNQNSASFQIGLSPSITKTSSDVLEITVKITLGRPA